jgi:CheY-like chemotaxis protein
MTQTILVVDDERHVRTLIEHALSPFEEVGVTITVAATGQDALESCKRTPPDLVFVDARLPGVSGYDLCDALRADPATKHALVVLMVDKGWEPSPGRCSDNAFAHVMTKPFDPEELRLVTGKLLGIDVEP